MTKKTNKTKKESFNNVKFSQEEFNEYKKRVGVFSKKKVAAGVIAATVLIGGGIGAGTYFGIKSMSNTGTQQGTFKDGEVYIDPSASNNAEISKFTTVNGDKVGTVTSKSKIIKDVTVSIGTTILKKGTEYTVESTSTNAGGDSRKVTIKKVALEKYKGSIFVNPIFEGAKNIFVVEFDSNGGSTIEKQKVEEGSAVTEPAKPTKGGCTFEYWCEDEALQNKFDFSTVITGDKVLYAKWKVDETTEGLEYYLNETQDGLCVFYNGLKSELKAVKVPSTAVDPESGNTLPVTEIAYEGFADCTNLEQIELPDSIQIIQGAAFENCFALKTVNIPEGIEYIINGTFKNCLSLKNITLPESVIDIGDEAFAHCSSLESITIPDAVTSLGSRCFEYTSLKSITIPSSVKSLGYYACFKNCEKLSNVILNCDLNDNELPDQTFFGCKSLVNFTLPSSIVTVGSQAFAKTGITKDTFVIQDIYSGWEYYDAAESGEWYSFDSKDIVKQLLAGTSLRKGAFKDSTVEANKIFKFNYIGNQSVEIMEDPVVVGETVTGEVEIPASITYNGVELKVTKIVDSAFSAVCQYATKVIIPSTIKSIGQWAFTGELVWNEETQQDEFVSKIKSIQIKLNDQIKSDLEIISSYAIQNLPTLESIYSGTGETTGAIILPEGLSYIGTSSFVNLEKITSITLPSTLTSLQYGIYNNGGGGEEEPEEYMLNSDPSDEDYDPDYDQYNNSFEKMTNLKEIKVAATNEIYASDDNGLLYLQYNQEKTHTLIFFPEGKKDGNDDPIKDVVIPEGVKRIYSAAITPTNNYETLTLPSSLTVLDYRFCFESYWYPSTFKTLTINSETIAQLTYQDLVDKYLTSNQFISNLEKIIVPNDIVISAGSYLATECGYDVVDQNKEFYKNKLYSTGDMEYGFTTYQYFEPIMNRTAYFVCDLGDTYSGCGKKITTMYFDCGDGQPVNVFDNSITIKYGSDSSSLTDLIKGTDYDIDGDNNQIVLKGDGRQDSGIYVVEIKFDAATLPESPVRLNSDGAEG